MKRSRSLLLVAGFSKRGKNTGMVLGASLLGAATLVAAYWLFRDAADEFHPSGSPAEFLVETMRPGEKSLSDSPARIGARTSVIIVPRTVPETREVPSTFGSVRIHATRGEGPVSGAVFTVTPKDILDFDVASVRVITDSEGSVTLAKLPGGAITIAPAFGAPKEARVTAGTETVVEFAMKGGFTLLGTVLDEHGRPAAKARIFETYALASDSPLAITNDEGRFSIAAIPAGTVSVRAQTTTLHCGSNEVLGGEGDTRRVEIKCEDARGAAEITCLGADHEPLRGEPIVVEVSDAEDDETCFEKMTTKTGSDGSVRLEPLRGPWTIRVRSATGWHGIVEVDVPAGETVRRTVDCEGGVRVCGVVYAGDGHTAVPDAKVDFVSHIPFCLSDFTRSTSADGRYEFPLLVRHGFRLSASHPQHGSVTHVFKEKPSGAKQDIDLILRVDNTLNVVVVDAAHSPQAGVYVVANAIDAGRHGEREGDDYACDTTGPDGRVALHNLAHTAFRVQCGPSFLERGWLVGERSIEAAPGPNEVTLNIGELQPAMCMVKGRLFDARKAPIGSVRIGVAHIANPDAMAHGVITDVEGRFECKGLAPGLAAVSVDSTRTGLAKLGEAELIPERPLDLGDITLSDHGIIEVRRTSPEHLAPMCELFIRYGTRGTLGEWVAFHGNDIASRSIAADTYDFMLGLSYPGGNGKAMISWAEDAQRLGLASLQRNPRFQVSPDQTTAIALPRIHSVYRPVVASWSDPAGSSYAMLEVAFGADSGTWVVAGWHEIGKEERTHTFPLRLPVGRHQVRVTVGRERAAETVVVEAEPAWEESYVAFPIRLSLEPVESGRD